MHLQGISGLKYSCSENTKEIVLEILTKKSKTTIKITQDRATCSQKSFDNEWRIKARRSTESDSIYNNNERCLYKQTI